MVEATNSKILVIRFAGEAGLSPKKLATLEFLGLKRKHSAAVVDATPSYLGMLGSVEKEVVWGPLDAEAAAALARWAKLPEDQVKRVESGDFSPLPRVFRLHPPRKGYGEFAKRRGEIGEEIKPLLMRMTRRHGLSLLFHAFSPTSLPSFDSFFLLVLLFLLAFCHFSVVFPRLLGSFSRPPTTWPLF
ncbi:MAG: uL30 family ribosomal protein [Candidatus Marsarchaeota archaeon]